MDRRLLSEPRTGQPLVHPSLCRVPQCPGWFWEEKPPPDQPPCTQLVSTPPFPELPNGPSRRGAGRGPTKTCTLPIPTLPEPGGVSSSRPWGSQPGSSACCSPQLAPGGEGEWDGTDDMDKLAADQGLCRVPSPCWLWWPRGQPLVPKPCGPWSPFWGGRQVDNTQPYNLGGGAWGSDLQLGRRPRQGAPL